MNKIIVGIGQINARDNVQQNLDKISAMVEELARKGAQLIVFPEYSTYNVECNFPVEAQDFEGAIIATFKNLAKTYNVYIHNGSFVEKIDHSDKVGNTGVLINPQGEIEACYRKIHLFDIALREGLAHMESDEFLPGKKLVNISNQLGDFGFATCYDLRFPEQYRELTLRGAKVIFTPAQFMLYTGKDHWEALLRARAIENQVYIIAPCGFGAFPPNEKRTFGNSMVVDPWGTIIARASERECCFTAEIDFDYLEQVRENIPSLKNCVDITQM